MQATSFKKESSMAIVVFSGFNMRAVYAFLRTLEKNNLDFHIVALPNNDRILLSKYKTKVCAIREKLCLDIEDITNSLIKVKTTVHADKLFIAPSTEALNRFLQKNRSYFEEMGCIIPLVDEKLYNQISDKKAFYDLCRANDIDVPREVEFDKKNIPFVVKPKYYEGDEILSAPIIVNSDEIFKKTIYNDEKYYCEEFLTGRSFYLLYYFSKGGSVHKLFQENLAQQPYGKSILAAKIIESGYDDSKFVKMFKSIGFYGLVMVEVRIKNNQFRMIEANPRFWGPSQLFVDYGCNFFDYFLEDYGFKVEETTSNDKNALYFWSGGFSCGTVWHNKIAFEYGSFANYDVYRRTDTMGVFKQEQIDRLYENYNAISKHSQYQILPQSLTKYINQDNLNIKSRAEQQRFDYIINFLSLKGKTILDVGANTGFFSFSAIDAGAEHVTSYEGNQAHAHFLQSAIELLDFQKIMDVVPKYYIFTETKKYDICFLLNVLHHLGDDYGDSTLNIQKAKSLMIQQINSMATICQTLVFQLGFNWKGNRSICLFDNGTKQEMIEFIKQGTSDKWEVTNIGVAEKTNGSIKYNTLSEKNIARDDSLGEFLNRPIFIMKSKLK